MALSKQFKEKFRSFQKLLEDLQTAEQVFMSAKNAVGKAQEAVERRVGEIRQEIFPGIAIGKRMDKIIEVDGKTYLVKNDDIVIGSGVLGFIREIQVEK